MPQLVSIPDDDYTERIVNPILEFEIILFIFGFVSLILNGLLLGLTIRRGCKHKALDVIFFFMISVLDLIASIVLIVGQIWKWSSNYTVLRDGSAWCYFNSVLGWPTVISSLDLAAILSFIRYFVLVRGNSVNNIRWACFGVWIVVFNFGLFIFKAINSPPIVLSSGMYCASLWKGSGSWSILFYLFYFITTVPPLFIIVFCYSKITALYRQRMKGVLSSEGDIKLPSFHRRYIALCSVAVGYSLVTLPEMIQSICFVLFDLVAPTWIDSIAKIFMFCSSVISAGFVLILHEETRRELTELYRTLRNRN